MLMSIGILRLAQWEHNCFSDALLANPVGGAIGQVISPLVSGTRNSVSMFYLSYSSHAEMLLQILVLGIISSAATPAASRLRVGGGHKYASLEWGRWPEHNDKVILWQSL